MSKEKSLPKNMLEDILARPSDKDMVERGLLPESCAWHLDTAITFARQTKRHLDLVRLGDSGTIHNALDGKESLAVVLEQLEEIKEKIRKAGK